MGAVVTGPEPIRVVLADDHPIWRDGVAADLGEGFTVVGTAGTATEAVAVIREQRLDLVVCDLTMPDGGGLKVVRECAGETRIVMLTVSEMERDVLDATGTNPLSEREREVLQLVARGHTYRQIGEELFISEKTVENHVRNILGKLQLSRRQELVRYALEHGLE